MNNIQKSLIIGFTLASFTFIHAINLIKENIFELNLGSIEKSSLIMNYLCLGIILFGICLLLTNNQSKLSMLDHAFSIHFQFCLMLFL